MRAPRPSSPRALPYISGCAWDPVYGDCRSRALLRAEILDDLREDVVEGILGPIADHRGNFAQIGDAARHVLEPRFVGLVVRDELERRARAGELPDAMGEIENPRLLRAADVDDLSDRSRVLHELNQRAH